MEADSGGGMFDGDGGSMASYDSAASGDSEFDDKILEIELEEEEEAARIASQRGQRDASII